MKTEIELPPEVRQWLFACEWLQLPRDWPLTPRQAVMMASKRWPLKSLGWLSANDQVRGIEYTNSAGQRIQRRWAELGRG
jgi:hypothetical protein